METVPKLVVSVETLMYKCLHASLLSRPLSSSALSFQLFVTSIILLTITYMTSHPSLRLLFLLATLLFILHMFLILLLLLLLIILTRLRFIRLLRFLFRLLLLFILLLVLLLPLISFLF